MAKKISANVITDLIQLSIGDDMLNTKFIQEFKIMTSPPGGVKLTHTIIIELCYKYQFYTISIDNGESKYFSCDSISNYLPDKVKLYINSYFNKIVAQIGCKIFRVLKMTTPTADGLIFIYDSYLIPEPQIHGWFHISKMKSLFSTNINSNINTPLLLDKEYLMTPTDEYKLDPKQWREMEMHKLIKQPQNEEKTNKPIAEIPNKEKINKLTKQMHCEKEFNLDTKTSTEIIRCIIPIVQHDMPTPSISRKNIIRVKDDTIPEDRCGDMIKYLQSLWPTKNDTLFIRYKTANKYIKQFLPKCRSNQKIELIFELNFEQKCGYFHLANYESLYFRNTGQLPRKYVSRKIVKYIDAYFEEQSLTNRPCYSRLLIVTFPNCNGKTFMYEPFFVDGQKSRVYGWTTVSKAKEILEQSKYPNVCDDVIIIPVTNIIKNFIYVTPLIRMIIGYLFE